MGDSLVIRDLAEDMKTELRVRAARNGRSVEEEARLILAAALAPPVGMAADGLPWSLGEATRMIFGPENGVELELTPRQPMRDPPDFSWVLDEPDEPEADEGGPERSKPDRWSSSTRTWFRNCCGRTLTRSCSRGRTACRATRSASPASSRRNCAPASNGCRMAAASGLPGRPRPVSGSTLGGRVFPLDRAAARFYAAFMAARERAGRPTCVPDALIAATARSHGARLLATRDTRDFEGCGVALVNPWNAAVGGAAPQTLVAQTVIGATRAQALPSRRSAPWVSSPRAIAG